MTRRWPAGIDQIAWQTPALNYPTFRLSILARAIDRLTLRALAQCSDLTVAEWRVLSRLGAVEAATVRAMADSAWADRSEVSRAASGLEARGFVERHENPKDRRSPLLSCTPKGRSEYERILPLRAAFHEQLLAGLEPWEQTTLDALLAKIAAGIADLEAPDGPSPSKNSVVSED